MEQNNYSIPHPPPSWNVMVPPNFNIPPPPLGSQPMQWQQFSWFQSTPQQFGSGTNLYTVPPPKIQKQEEASCKDSDELWIRNWANKFKLNNDEREKKPTVIQISTFKEKLRTFLNIVLELESLHNCMKVLKKTLKSTEWNERCKFIKEKKETLKYLASEIHENRKVIQILIKKRLKKRLREKTRKIKRHKLKMESKLHQSLEHKKIDMWLEKMTEEVERAKREEQIKAEADAVLSEVTKKKSEAKRTLALLSNLSKLRNARVQSAKARGGNLLENGIETFNQIIGRLKKYWIDQLNEYNMEEKGLRVMLDHAEVERSDVALSLKREILNEWNETIFGKTSQENSKFDPTSIDELISVRCAWDKYVCYDNKVVMASKIPIGWVLPTGPSSQDWAKLLKL